MVSQALPDVCKDMGFSQILIYWTPQSLSRDSLHKSRCYVRHKGPYMQAECNIKRRARARMVLSAQPVAVLSTLRQLLQ